MSRFSRIGQVNKGEKFDWKNSLMRKESLKALGRFNFQVYLSVPPEANIKSLLDHCTNFEHRTIPSLFSINFKWRKSTTVSFGNVTYFAFNSLKNIDHEEQHMEDYYTLESPLPTELQKSVSSPQLALPQKPPTAKTSSRLKAERIISSLPNLSVLLDKSVQMTTWPISPAFPSLISYEF